MSSVVAQEEARKNVGETRKNAIVTKKATHGHIIVIQNFICKASSGVFEEQEGETIAEAICMHGWTCGVARS